MRILLLSLSALLLSGCADLSAFLGTNANQNFKAYYAIYIDGKKLDLSQRTDLFSTPSHSPHEFLRITADNPSVIHVSRAGLTFAEFLLSHSMALTSTCFMYASTEEGNLICAKANNPSERWRLFIKGAHEVQLDPFRILFPQQWILLTFNATDEEIAEQIAATEKEACEAINDCD